MAWKERKEFGKMETVWQKLKKTKELSKEINIKHYKGIEDRIKKTRDELHTI